MQGLMEPAANPVRTGFWAGGDRASGPGQTALFFDVYRWLWRDAIRRHPVATLGVVLLDFGSVGLGAALIGVILRSISTLAAGEPLRLPTFGDAEIAGPVLGVGLLAIATLSATLGWATDWLVQRTAARYQHDCAMRAVRCLAEPGPASWALAGTDSPQQTARQAARVAPTILNRCLTWLMASIRHALIGVVAAVVMVVIQPGLTASLLPLLPVYLWSLLWLGGRARGSGAISQAARRRYAVALDAFEEEESEANLADVNAASQEVADIWAERRLMASRSTFLNGLLFAMILAVLFVSVAISAGGDTQDWARLAAYVVALRFLVGGLRANTNTIVRLQLQPEALNAFRTMVGARPIPPVTPDGAIGSLISGSRTRPGQGAMTLLLVVPWRPSRLDLGLAEALLGPHLAPGESFWNLERDAPPGEPQAGESWMACRIGRWHGFTDALAVADSTFARKLLLVVGEGVTPERLLRRTEGRSIDGVVVWSGNGKVEVGDWSWYEGERFTGSREVEPDAEVIVLDAFDAGAELEG